MPDVQNSMPSTTTAAQDLASFGQRRINLLWEMTQAAVAIAVTLTTLGVCAYLVVSSSGWTNVAFLLLSNVFFLVVGTYFQRTNHTKTGGISGPFDR
jgi:CHASE2 domain-containing sensor protein